MKSEKDSDAGPKDTADIKPAIAEKKETSLSPDFSSKGTPSPPTLPTGEEEKAASVQVALQRIPSSDLPRRLESVSEDSLLTDNTSPENSVSLDSAEKQKSPLFVPAAANTKDSTTPSQVSKPAAGDETSNITTPVLKEFTVDRKRKPSDSNPIQLAKKSTCQLTCKRTGTGIIISKKSKYLFFSKSKIESLASFRIYIPYSYSHIRTFAYKK